MAIWKRVLRWGRDDVPPGADDAALRASFTRESRERGLRTLRRVLPFGLAIHGLAILVFSRTATSTPAEVDWLGSLVRIHFALGLVALVSLVITLREGLPRVREHLGDAVGVLYILGTAAVTANAQRAHPNLSSFTFGAVGIGFILHMQPRLYLGSVAAGGALVAWAVAHHAERSAGGTADIMSLLVVVAISTAGFFASRNMRFREHVARIQVERLNAELENRVASQVNEIVARAREVDELNKQLNQKVRERSRELTMALGRLAADHEGLPRGTILGDRVEIDRPIGKGGMGAVYSARDLATGKTVAVKVVQAGSANELDDLYRFLREAQALASLIHPAIVRSLHVDVADDGRLFQVMELVAGETLQAHVDRVERLSSFHVARLGAVLAEGLAAAHAAGVIHRDVKPANVMLTRAAPGLKLLDFGISKLRDARHQAGGTHGSLIGTLEFMSPEQVTDPSLVTDRADVYQLGIVLYLCLSGRLPYTIDSARSWLVAHALQRPEDLAAVVPDADPEVAAAVMRCLAKAPAERPSASDLARTLAALADAAGTPPLEDLDLCAAPTESGAPPADPVVEVETTGVRGAIQPWRRTLKAHR